MFRKEQPLTLREKINQAALVQAMKDQHTDSRGINDFAEFFPKYRALGLSEELIAEAINSPHQSDDIDQAKCQIDAQLTAMVQEKNEKVKNKKRR